MIAPAIKFVLLPVVAGSIVGLGVALLAADTLLRAAARVTGVRGW